jgi:hypothetical protein
MNTPLSPLASLPLILKPFPGSHAPDRVALSAAAERLEHGRLRLSWRLVGRVEALLLPEVPDGSEPSKRRDGLWQHTCFEAFLAPVGETAYWELNLAPSGDWNLYRFDGYRQGQRPEIEPNNQMLTRRSGPLLRDVIWELPLPPELAAASGLELAITAVLQESDGACSYWALAHCGAEPDFHRRESFVLSL